MWLELIVKDLSQKSILKDALRHDGLLDLVVAPSKMVKDKITWNKSNKGRADADRTEAGHDSSTRER